MKQILIITFILTLISSTHAQDTFSIVAVDSVTGEVGSAGASCLDESAIAGGAIIISDILPGRGAIHTQSFWIEANQDNAHARMKEGMSPEEIIEWLIENDVQNNPGRRQYGIVDFDSTGSPRAAAFTGETCYDWKGHVTGGYYSIQGNILLGEQIIDSMESRFLNTEGMLAEKLMAALQGANVVGADTRCTSEGVSSLSAFIRVAQEDDTIGPYYLDINVPSTPYGVEPIDSLQVLFDQWLNLLGTDEKFVNHPDIKVYPNPAVRDLTVEVPEEMVQEGLNMELTDPSGRPVAEKHVENVISRIETGNLTPGFYLLTLRKDGRLVYREKVLVQ